ncbi:hypothetical protein DVK00_02885 [Haloarcula sp. Atlit-47R]|uniref:hypothetical protein n=1 Tax=Haloarcula sp. Atlit-47R TaxID=2282132 RepID=UPI000EF1EBC1|nr:hypothetical protein [Haloarcula sp. Atlit-47R]RLM47470.1 hypothetical protein DVK00_02885 [Haloarcula sp. Atlit-47R]
MSNQIANPFVGDWDVTLSDDDEIVIESEKGNKHFVSIVRGEHPGKPDFDTDLVASQSPKTSNRASGSATIGKGDLLWSRRYTHSGANYKDDYVVYRGDGEFEDISEEEAYEKAAEMESIYDPTREVSEGVAETQKYISKAFRAVKEGDTIRVAAEDKEYEAEFEVEQVEDLGSEWNGHDLSRAISVEQDFYLVQKTGKGHTDLKLIRRVDDDSTDESGEFSALQSIARDPWKTHGYVTELRITDAVPASGHLLVYEGDGYDAVREKAENHLFLGDSEKYTLIDSPYESKDPIKDADNEEYGQKWTGDNWRISTEYAHEFIEELSSDDRIGSVSVERGVLEVGGDVSLPEVVREVSSGGSEWREEFTERFVEAVEEYSIPEDYEHYERDDNVIRHVWESLDESLDVGQTLKRKFADAVHDVEDDDLLYGKEPEEAFEEYMLGNFNRDEIEVVLRGFELLVYGDPEPDTTAPDRLTLDGWSYRVTEDGAHSWKRDEPTPGYPESVGTGIIVEPVGDEFIVDVYPFDEDGDPVEGGFVSAGAVTWNTYGTRTKAQDNAVELARKIRDGEIETVNPDEIAENTDPEEDDEEGADVETVAGYEVAPDPELPAGETVTLMTAQEDVNSLGQYDGAYEIEADVSESGKTVSVEWSEESYRIDTDDLRDGPVSRRWKLASGTGSGALSAEYRGVKFFVPATAEESDPDPEPEPVGSDVYLYGDEDAPEPDDTAELEDPGTQFEAFQNVPEYDPVDPVPVTSERIMVAVNNARDTVYSTVSDDLTTPIKLTEAGGDGTLNMPDASTARMVENSHKVVNSEIGTESGDALEWLVDAVENGRSVEDAVDVAGTWISQQDRPDAVDTASTTDTDDDSEDEEQSDLSALTSLSGIGEATAETFRDEYGATTPDELADVWEDAQEEIMPMHRSSVADSIGVRDEDPTTGSDTDDEEVQETTDNDDTDNETMNFIDDRTADEIEDAQTQEEDDEDEEEGGFGTPPGAEQSNLNAFSIEESGIIPGDGGDEYVQPEWGTDGRIEIPDEELIDGQDGGTLGKNFRGYTNAMRELQDAMETMQEEWDHAQSAAKSINSIRDDHGQAMWHFVRLEQFHREMGDMLEAMHGDCHECHHLPYGFDPEDEDETLGGFVDRIVGDLD